MKNKKILGGLVAVAVLLSGTTVLYFAGVERPGVTPVLARPPDDNDCHIAGGFCAIDLGMSGGCNPSDCCPPWKTYCPGWDYRQPYEFREVGSPPEGSLGTCWTYNGSQPVLYCREKYCSNQYLCNVNCVAANPFFDRTSTPPIALNASCLPCL